jgi:pre-mRNA cleavage complex 2 protein Pcf11
VILMGVMADEPKEISFQKDGRSRTVFINRLPVEISIGETKHFDWGRKPYTMRLGAPTRELYINGRHYEVCFGGPPIKVRLILY